VGPLDSQKLQKMRQNNLERLLWKDRAALRKRERFLTCMHFECALQSVLRFNNDKTLKRLNVEATFFPLQTERDKNNYDRRT
jgi:hypothetical protein